MTKKKSTIYSVFAVIIALAVAACAASPSPAPAVPELSPLVELSGAIRDVSHHLNSNVPAGRMIAFVNVQSGSVDLSNFIVDDLIANAVTDRIFTVVDRQQLDHIRAEQNIQLSGEVDDNTALSIGRFSGAQTVVTGWISSLGGYFRLTVRALDVETAHVQGQYNRVIGTERAMAALIGTGGRQIAHAPVPQPVRPMAAQAPVVQPVQVPVAQAPTVSPAPAFRIGDTGPAGGIIFFDQGNHSGGWRWMEAAPVDLGPVVFATEVIPVNAIRHFGFRVRTAAWGEWGGDRSSRALGAGKSNTEHLMSLANNRGGGFGWAVRLAAMYELNGFDDWFLPSQDELNHMYGNLHMRRLGNFRSERYWSSSMGDDGFWTGVQYINFANGEARTALQDSGDPPTVYRTARFLVRPIRRF